MGFLRKLLKVLLVVVVVLLLGIVVLVWPILGVNPLEGRADHLWELVSAEVDFFVRFPGTRLLRSDLADTLATRPGFERLIDIREQLAEFLAEQARLINPQLPLGLGDFDADKLEADLLGREMAFAGTVRSDYARMRPDNFIALTRVAWYGRFVSALRRGFVRDRIPEGSRIEVVSGLYLKISLDEQAKQSLAALRSETQRSAGEDALYLGRIRDVIVVSDRSDWIEHALQGGSLTISADTEFQTGYVEYARESDGIELFTRLPLTMNLLLQHSRETTGGPLVGVRRFVPVEMAGDVCLRADPEPDGLALTLFNKPRQDGFREVREAHLQKLYEREKADLSYDLSENGIGRFIPRDNTVAAVLLHAAPDELIGLVLELMTASQRELFEREVREAGYRRGLEALLRELVQDLGDTHLLIVHRPSVFEAADLTRYRDDAWPPTPEGQLSFSLVSRVRDAAVPDKVRERIFANLPNLQMMSLGVHESGDFHMAQLVNEPADLRLFKPAYGGIPGTRAFLFSSSVEGAQWVLRASKDPTERMLAQPEVVATIRKLPAEGTLALVARGEMLYEAMEDRVRRVAEVLMAPDQWAARKRQEWIQAGMADDEELSRKVREAKEVYIEQEYPGARETYLNAIEWLRAIDTMAAAVTLGVGPTKEVHALGFVRLTGKD